MGVGPGIAPGKADGAPSIPQKLTLVEYYLEHNLARGRGEKIAVYHGDETYTFRELCGLTNKMGNVLERLGVGLEDRVLLILRDQPEWLAAWFATMKIGGVATHAYTYLPASDYDYFIEYVRPKVVIVDETTLHTIRQSTGRSAVPTTLLVAGADPPRLQAGEYALNDLLQEASPIFEESPANRNSLAFWNFSGGTTGKPKGVPHHHAHGVFGAQSFQTVAHYAPDDVILRVPKLFFHYARDLGMNWPLRAGAAVCLFPERTTPELVFRLIDKYRPTVLVNVPTMMRAMLESPAAASADFSCMRVCLSSGEVLSEKLYEDFTQTFGVEVINSHGSAETNLGFFVDHVGQVRPGSSGQLAPLVQVKLIIGEGGEGGEGGEVAPGETGVLLVKSGAAGHGYHAAPEATRDTFLEGGWVNTNDLFREDADGYFWYMGRADDLIKVSGIYVAPLEIEKCLETHPAVRACAVMGVADTDGLAKTKAFVVLRDGSVSGQEMAEELGAFCQARMAGYKVPKSIEFLAELPATGQGKVDRRRLIVADGERTGHAFTTV